MVSFNSTNDNFEKELKENKTENMSSGSNGAPSFLSGLSGVNTRVKTYSESSDGAAANSPGGKKSFTIHCH